MDMFLTELENEEERIREDLKHPVAMRLTPQEEELFARASTCWICGKALDGNRVRDHDHITGDFRGAAHQA